MVTTLILKTTRSQYGSPFDNDDYVVLHDGHVIGRIMLHPLVPEGARGSGQSLRWIILRQSTVAAIQRHAKKR